MIVYVDIDETICEYENEREYPLAKPLPKNIGIINELRGNILDRTRLTDRNRLDRTYGRAIKKVGRKIHQTQVKKASL